VVDAGLVVPGPAVLSERAKEVMRPPSSEVEAWLAGVTSAGMKRRATPAKTPRTRLSPS